MRTIILSSCLAVVGLFTGVVGCATEAEEADGDQSAITPDDPPSMFELAQHCDSMVRGKIGVREADVKSGVVRWKCGDVDGVTAPDLGQEYCEYHAVQDGKVIDNSNKPNGTVECVYTSHFAEGTRLSTASLKSALNASNEPPRSTVQMQNGVNSRGAATTLIRDCQQQAQRVGLKAGERTAACLETWKTASDADKKKIKDACMKDLNNDANWNAAKALGVKDLTGPDAEVAKDVGACAAGFPLSVAAQQGKIVAFRNSDPTICARIQRATAECGDSFGALPNALPGFAMTSWVDDFDPSTPPQAPVGCRYVSIDGAPSQQALICTPSPDAVTKAKQAGKIMQQMCNEQFGGLVAMAAPVGAVATKGSKSSPFCDAFHSGVDLLQGNQ